jgi:hypothetical protein
VTTGFRDSKWGKGKTCCVCVCVCVCACLCLCVAVLMKGGWKVGLTNVAHYTWSRGSVEAAQMDLKADRRFLSSASCATLPLELTGALVWGS